MVKIDVNKYSPHKFVVSIEGITDLVLSSRNPFSTNSDDYWTKAIHKLHWRDGWHDDYSAESFLKNLKHNAPCLVCIGVYSALEETAISLGYEEDSISFARKLSIAGKGLLIPIQFKGHHIEDVMWRTLGGGRTKDFVHVFEGWSADIEIHTLWGYSEENVAMLVSETGMMTGVGSCRKSGRGRFRVTDIKKD